MALTAGILFGTAQLRAEPEWWKDPTAVPAMTSQSGKGVVIYFESEKAADCIRMMEETWSQFSAEEADADFVWLKVNPLKNKIFFSHYEVLQVPEIVVLDSKLEERLRVKGFVEAWVLKERLKEVPRDKPTVQTTSDGRIVHVEETEKAEIHRKNIEKDKPFFYESFDDLKDWNQARLRQIVVVKKAASRFDPTGGAYNSGCLVIDSGDEPSAAIRIDLSKGLDKVQQVEGRLRVRLRMRAYHLLQEILNVAAVTLVRQDDPGGNEQARRFYMTLAERHEQWYEREVITDSFNFRMYKPILTLQVNGRGLSFGVEDLRVDLLPPDTPGTEIAAVQVAAATPDPAKLLALPTEDPLFQRFDKDKDGRIFRDDLMKESPKAVPLFDKMDRNRDGMLTYLEAEMYFNRGKYDTKANGGGRQRQTR